MLRYCALIFDSTSCTSAFTWLLLTLGAVACSGADPRNPAAGSEEPVVPMSPGGDAASQDGGLCREDEIAECSVFLGEHNGVRSCFHGAKQCRRGSWGPCVDRHAFDASDAAPRGGN